MKDVVSNSERTLILAPRGRDALVAKAILRDADVRSEICVDLAELVQEIMRGADLSIITEEATRIGNLRDLIGLIAAQPPWLDFPFVILTEHGGGLERNPTAAQLMQLARKRDLSRASVSPHYARERRSVGITRPTPPVRVPAPERGVGVAGQRANRGAGGGQPATSGSDRRTRARRIRRYGRCSGWRRSGS